MLLFLGCKGTYLYFIFKKNQPFSKKISKTADFYTAMVHQISAKCIIIAEILHLLINYFVWDKMQKLA
jgi:hypothetical protein